MIEIYTRNFDRHITVPSPNLAFLCRNLDYKPYSINQFDQLIYSLIIYVDDDFDYELLNVYVYNAGCKNIFIKVHKEKETLKNSSWYYMLRS